MHLPREPRFLRNLRSLLHPCPVDLLERPGIIISSCVWWWLVVVRRNGQNSSLSTFVLQITFIFMHLLVFPWKDLLIFIVRPEHQIFLLCFVIVLFVLLLSWWLNRPSQLACFIPCIVLIRNLEVSNLRILFLLVDNTNPVSLNIPSDTKMEFSFRFLALVRSKVILIRFVFRYWLNRILNCVVYGVLNLGFCPWALLWKESCSHMVWVWFLNIWVEFGEALPVLLGMLEILFFLLSLIKFSKFQSFNLLRFLRSWIIWISSVDHRHDHFTINESFGPYLLSMLDF